MRLFNFRYLLFAAAMLAVWLLARSRNVQPELDASWTPIVVSESDGVVSVDGVQSIAVCQQNGACTDNLASVVENVAQAVPDMIVTDQVASIDDSNMFDESNLAGELNVLGEEGLTEPNQVDSSLDFAPDFEQFAPESDEAMASVSVDKVDVVEPPSESEADFFESVVEDQIEASSLVAKVRSSDSATVGSFDVANQRTYNRFANEVEDSQQSKATSVSWKKNPFIGDSVDLSNNADTAVPDRPAPLSPEQSPGSILDLDSTSRASYPEPDRSQMDYVQNEVAHLKDLAPSTDITPVNATLSESVAQEAVHHIEYGKSLSRRGASFGARQKFFAAMGVIARGNDVQNGGNAYTTALGRAIRALREVQDFAVRNADIGVGISVAEILETHQTHIISEREAAVMPPVEAMQRYFTFAHQQLSFAGGKNVVSAEALFCLGKLHSVMAKHQPETLDIAKAIVFHRASLSSDIRDSRSYNELGVLLARSGQLAEAEELFKKSLQINPNAGTWQNLAKTHNRQGEAELAQLAQSEFVIATQLGPVASKSSQIAWLPGQAFNQVGPADFLDSKPSSPAVITASRTTDVDADADDKKTFADRFNNLKKWF